MKWKFVEALLHLAVALSFTDWNYRNEFDNSFAGTYIPNDISLGSANIPDSRVGPHSQTAKEEANIIDSIINWEETQRFSGFGRNTDFLAFPIVSQNSAISLEHIDSDPSSRSSLCSQQVGAISPGNAAGSTSSSEGLLSPETLWPQSPGSSLDDGELFGAVGYTPQSSTQYFDIESFLNANVSSPTLGSHSYFDSVTGPNWVDQPLLPASSVKSETVEELAQFLKDSLHDIEAEDCNQKVSFLPSIDHYSDDDMSSNLADALDDIFDSHNKKSVAASAVIHQSFFDKTSGNEDIDLLASSSSDQNAAAYKGEIMHF